MSAPGAGTQSLAEIEALERSAAPRPAGWAWILVVVGFAVMIGLGAYAAMAYTTIDGINQAGRLQTANPVLLLQDLSVNGPRVPSNIETNSRATYTRALTQYVLAGTGVCLGLALAFGGLFIRINR